METRVAIPEPGVDVLRTLEREASDAENGARRAAGRATRARARSNAVRSALCAAIGVPAGNITLDLTAGCFVVATPDPGCEKTA